MGGEVCGRSYAGFVGINETKGKQQKATHLAAGYLDELGHDLGEAQGHGVLDLELQPLELVEAERLEAPATKGWMVWV